MQFDHYITTLSPREDFYLDRLQPLVWQSLIDAVHCPDTLIALKPIVLCFNKTELFVPGNYFQVFEYKKQDSEIAPELSDVLELIKISSDSEWVIISHPDVLIKQNFYSIIEYFIASGHDAIAVSTSNAMSADLSLIRRKNLVVYTWQNSGFTQNVDCFVFHRKYLEKFIVGKTYAGLPYSAEVLWANLLKNANRFKFLYDYSITCRFNNILFWDNNTRYDREIINNREQSKIILDQIGFTDKEKESEHHRRLELRLKDAEVRALTFNKLAESDTVNVSKNTQKLPGNSWAVTTYFNPNRSQKILENYRIFSKNLKKQNVPLLTVELSFAANTFDLNSSDADKVVQIDDGDVLWQKERMFNLALKHLPNECDKIVYMDADILFSDPNWLKNTESKLEEYCFVQPFSHVVRLPKNGEMQSLDHYEVGWEDGQTIHSFAWGLEKFGQRALKLYPHHGTVGIALAARRSVMEKHGWFDADIVGSGDLLTIDSIMLADNYRAGLMNDKFREFFEIWQKSFRLDVKNSLSYAPGIVYHYWHGSSKNRFYQERHSILEEYEYDPNKDIELSAKGVWKWKSNKTHLHAAVKKYFSHRDDD